MTNYEKIKMMSLEEMADFLGFFNVEEEICFFNNKDMGVEYCKIHSCSNCALRYLESEAGA